MDTPVRYADFIKSIGNTEIHNTTTIIEIAEASGLLQRLFEQKKAAQLSKTQDIDEAKRHWSDERPELQFPESDEPITIEGTRVQAHGAIRGLQHRKRKQNQFPKKPDGLASNDEKGWLGFRWKLALTDLNWTREEWEALNREFQEWQETTSIREESKSERKPTVSWRPLALFLFSSACLGLAVSVCWFENGKQLHTESQFATKKLSTGSFIQPSEEEINMSPSNYVSTNLGPTTCPQPPKWHELSITWQGSSPAVVATGGRPVMLLAGIP